MTSTAHFDSATDTASERQPEQSAMRQRTFEWSDPRETAEFGAGLSGMDFFTAMVEGRVPPPPIMHTIGISGFSFEEGRVVFRLTPQEFHYNPLGSVHGGVFATLLDSACGCAVHTKLPVGVFYTSLDLSVKFLRPVSIATGEIAAEATVMHFGRRMALAEGRIVDAAGRSTRLPVVAA